MSDPGDMVGLNLRFFGLVQGVGFRYSFLKACQEMGLGGWVRNLPDGSVEAEVHGAGDQVEGALEAIRRSRGGAIREIRRQALEWDPHRVRFEILP